MVISDDKRSKEDFERYVAEGLDSLPSEILERLSNVAVTVEDEPSREQMKQLGMSKGDTLLGLYEGIPQTERGSMYEGIPDRITIFRKSIENQSDSEDDIRELVRITVWHEVAHHFGMDEEDIKSREEREGKQS